MGLSEAQKTTVLMGLANGSTMQHMAVVAGTTLSTVKRLKRKAAKLGDNAVFEKKPRGRSCLVFKDDFSAAVVAVLEEKPENSVRFVQQAMKEQGWTASLSTTYRSMCRHCPPPTRRASAWRTGGRRDYGREVARDGARD